MFAGIGGEQIIREGLEEEQGMVDILEDEEESMDWADNLDGLEIMLNEEDALQGPASEPPAEPSDLVLEQGDEQPLHPLEGNAEAPADGNVVAVAGASAPPEAAGQDPGRTTAAAASASSTDGKS
jgi:hypothetical protein